MSRTENVLIIGAGVDCTEGINLPPANRLLPEIAQFIEGEGKQFEQGLRSVLPHLKFSFQRFITSSVDSLSDKEPSELSYLVLRVQEVIDKIKDEHDPVKKQGRLVVLLFEKLMSIQKASVIEEDIHELIVEVFGDQAAEVAVGDSVVDLHKLSLSDTFKNVFKLTLKQSLTEAPNEVAVALGGDMLNIEQLMIEKFLGFYNEKPGDVKNYIYIAWCLWAYLVHEQRAILERLDGDPVPFYSGIPSGTKVISLNYTIFLEESVGKKDAVYFHGNLRKYVRMDTRDLTAIDDFGSKDIMTILEQEVLPNIDLSAEEMVDQKHVIPAMVPPLRLKPILSREYIEVWHEADQWVKTATKIVIVGYSLSTSDEHFNDILRAHSGGKLIDIVGPDVLSERFKKRCEKVFGIAPRAWSNTNVQGFDTQKSNGIRLIEAKADEVNLAELFAT